MISPTVNKKGRSITADPSRCAGCITCMLRCSFRLERGFNLSKARIRINRTIGQADEFTIGFTPECDACLICVRYCPYGALTGQKEGKEA